MKGFNTTSNKGMMIRAKNVSFIAFVMDIRGQLISTNNTRVISIARMSFFAKAFSSQHSCSFLSAFVTTYILACIMGLKWFIANAAYPVISGKGNRGFSHSHILTLC